MKLLIVALLFAVCMADFVDDVMDIVEEKLSRRSRGRRSRRSRGSRSSSSTRKKFDVDDRATWYFPRDKRQPLFGSDYKGTTRPSRGWRGDKGRRTLSWMDDFEEEVGSKGEPAFFIDNQFKKASVFVKFDCDRHYLKKETHEASLKIEGSYGGFEGSAEGSYKNEREFDVKFVEKTGFSKVGPGMFLEEGVPDDCSMIYATVFAKTKGGHVVKILNTSGIARGKVVRLSGSPSNPEVDKTYEVCGGEGCGCWQGYCWTECALGWCYSTHKGWGTLSGSSKTCKRNQDCAPGNRCSHACTP